MGGGKVVRRRYGRGLAGTLAGLVVASAAGCAGGGGGVESGASSQPTMLGAVSTSPPASGPTSTAAPARTPQPRPDRFAALKAAVTKRYREYHVVVARAGAAANPDDPALPRYATGKVLRDVRNDFAANRLQGRSAFGTAVPHVSSVTIGAGTALVLDCLDASRTGVVDNLGRTVQFGLSRQQVAVTLLAEAGVWKVASIAPVEAGGVC
jgi:hypothetical protein